MKSQQLLRWFIALWLGIYEQGLAAESNGCVTIKLDSFGNIAIHSDLIKGGLAHALLPRPVIGIIDVIPPLDGVLDGPTLSHLVDTQQPHNETEAEAVYIDMLTVSWNDSRDTKPVCTLSVLSPWVGQFFSCSVDWEDKPLMLAVIFNTKNENVDLDKVVREMKNYINERLLSCPDVPRKCPECSTLHKR